MQSHALHSSRIALQPRLQRHRRQCIVSVASCGRSGEQAPTLSRRAGLAAAAAVVLGARRAAAAELPPPPPIGDCPDCIGEVNDTLNACPLASSSCISTLNDDEAHFQAPWLFDGDREAAVEQLIDVATGGRYEGGLISAPFGISRADAAAYIAGGVLAVLKGEDLPQQPQRQRSTEFVPFDGALVERKVTQSGCIYVRLLLGAAGGAATEVEDPSSVIDAEFLFLPNDSIAVVRAGSRAEPPRSGGQLQLSFTQGVVVDKNVARRKMEELRQALHWELAPVITDFDPRFNPEAPLWFERLFRPFDERNSFVPSGEAYPRSELMEGQEVRGGWGAQ